jgi:serine/threonine-protein kinase
MIPREVYERLAQIAWVHAPSEGELEDEGKIGRYRVVDRIGTGAASVVFRAVDPEGQEVAIKVLRRRRGSRHLREIELLERTAQHPGVVALLDAGRCAKGPYLVLELAEGGSLRSKVGRSGSLAWREAVELVIRVARTLEGLHAEGIIHRDLKPENILLQGDGRPLLSDFGLAKDLGDADGELTAAGFALGTVGYMSPELLDGRRDQLGPWTDVFSLGAVLFELIAGRQPFSGKTLNEAARSIREGFVPSLPDVPSTLNEVVRRCLAKEHRKRFRDAGELAAALAPILEPAAPDEEPAP